MFQHETKDCAWWWTFQHKFWHLCLLPWHLPDFKTVSSLILLYLLKDKLSNDKQFIEIFFFLGFGVKVRKFFQCFSLIKNTSCILDTKVPPGAITSINGLRVLSMWWVILGHTYLWLLVYRTISKSVLHLHMGGPAKGETHEGWIKMNEKNKVLQDAFIVF